MEEAARQLGVSRQTPANHERKETKARERNAGALPRCQIAARGDLAGDLPEDRANRGGGRNAGRRDHERAGTAEREVRAREGRADHTGSEEGGHRRGCQQQATEQDERHGGRARERGDDERREDEGGAPAHRTGTTARSGRATVNATPETSSTIATSEKAFSQD